MESAKEFRLIFVTVGNYESARQMARTLVSEQLAACCNIIHGVDSIFGWRGSIQEAQEIMMIIKTSADRLELLEHRIRELHTYDVPEIISVALQESSAEYLQWLRGTLE